MGRTLTPEQEAARLTEIIREAHGVIRDLRVTVKLAQALIKNLLIDIQKTVDREMGQLANHIQAENNEAAARLNREVKDAKEAIIRQLMITEMRLDPETETFTFHFPNEIFQDQIPMPHPEYLPEEKTP